MDKGLVGGTLDNTGLTHIGAREYDPAIGRFISVDPLMDTTDPQQWNGYAYANNSPVTFSDPTGLLAMGCMDDGPCGSQGARESYTPAAPTEASDAPGGESPRQKFTRENSPRTSDHSRLITIWSSGYQSFTFGGRFWDNSMGDGENSCFGRTACQMAWIHLMKNPHDIAGAKDIAANYCRDNWSTCSKHESWERLADNFMNMAAGGTGAASRVLRNAESRIRAACGPHSFAGDTRVLMADGSTKRIDEIEVGDQVLATDPETGESGAREVVATIIGEEVKNLVGIEVDGAEIIATDRHPFWLPERKEWADARDLYAGSVLQTSAGASVRVAAVRKWSALKRVHNLTVDGIHTYSVLAGKTPVLVHNCGPGTGQTRMYVAGRPGTDTTPQAPLPAGALVTRGGNLQDGNYHYVVMPGGSVRAFHESVYDARVWAGHTSLSGGKPVTMAGTFDVSNGSITEFGNFSGHYRPNGPGMELVVRDALGRNGFDVSRARWDPFNFG